MSGCSDDDGTGSVTVLAAASLTETFEDLRTELEDRHPGLAVELSFGSSSGLVEQLMGGAPADVIATADTTTMDDAVSAGVIAGDLQIFARNTLTLVVPDGNPGRVTGLADLGKDELRVAICEPQVPCGSAAGTLLDNARVAAAPDTLTTDVKEALSLVTLGEADAALVYSTDAVAAGGDVETVEVPATGSVANDYPIALVADARNPDGAQLVIDAVTGELGQTILGEAGFGQP